jgi:hypothetical protein
MFCFVGLVNKLYKMNDTYIKIRLKFVATFSFDITGGDRMTILAGLLVLHILQTASAALESSFKAKFITILPGQSTVQFT